MLAKLQKLLKSNRNVYLLILVFGFVLYGNTLGNKMFWDDQDNILFNQYVHNWQYFGRYFTENNVAGRGLISNYWRPLPLTIWSLEWHLWQDWAPGYHLVQLLLHTTAAFLLFLFLKILFKNLSLVLPTVLLFLVHPLQTEAIAYVSGLSDPLSALLLFTSLIFYIKFRESNSRVTCYLSLVTYALCFLVRETAVFFLGYFVLAEFILHSRQKEWSGKGFTVTTVRNLWPYALIALLYVLLRAGPLNFQNTFNLYNEPNAFTSNIFIRILTFFRIITIYLQLLFWPFNLHMERSVELATSLLHPDVLIGGFIFLASLSLSLTLAIRNPRKYSLLVFGILWFWLGLFPTSNILIPINGLLFEHWLYIPQIGIWLIVIWLGIKLARKHKVMSFSLVTCYLLLVTFLSVRTIRQNRIWHDPITFYNYTLKFAPDSYRVINNLGMAYADENNQNEAIRIYQLAISKNPSNSVAYHNLGNSYKALNEKQKAIDSFNKAISLQPTFFFSYNALAQLYYEDKAYSDAQAVFQKLYDNTGSPDALQYAEQLRSIQQENK
ncbi:MAG: tetratricopeptide repeat protein [Candidatus Blackburnbacteria bacterium]|nr:tetratricopeptide repeat protein [Candidatus Blackburnbacteria bacterium]